MGNPIHTTMQSYLRRLTPIEQQIICNALNDYKKTSEFHRGVLPFVPWSDVFNALYVTNNILSHYPHEVDGKIRPIIARIIAKLGTRGDSVSFVMYLDNKAVYRRFGSNPERGIRIAGIGPIRVTAGLKWSLPHQGYIPDDKTFVTPMVALKPLKIEVGRWLVSVEKKYKLIAHKWLCDHCV